jgi:hypothetical protein
MGELARKRVETEFDAKRQGGRLGELYLEAMKGGGRSSSRH